MKNPIENLQHALDQGTKLKPKVGGFPYLAETLSQAGVLRNIWTLPSCQSVFITQQGNVVIQGTPLVSGMLVIPDFDEGALIRAIRTDQAGESTFPEFLQATWNAGVVRYDVDFAAREVSYFGASGEFYVEEYPKVDLSDLPGLTD